jgi:hypothetical protein
LPGIAGGPAYVCGEEEGSVGDCVAPIYDMAPGPDGGGGE